MANLYRCMLDLTIGGGGDDVAPKDRLLEERYQRDTAASEAIQVEFDAAQRIQSWWRGYLTRQRIVILKKNVQIIQKHYRAFKGRRRYRERLMASLAEQRQEHYTKSALIIQRHWRGYWSRMKRHDFYKRKAYIEAVRVKNLQIQQLTEQERKRKEAEHEMVKEQLALDKLMQSPSGKHYMLSTETIRGVYNPPQGLKATAKDIGVIEDKIRGAVQASVKSQSRRMRQAVNKSQTSAVPPPPPPQWMSEVARKKPIQGPFKPLTDVWTQRVKELKPTLRVATSHTSEQDMRVLEKHAEWTKRIQEARFNATIEPKYPYVPSIFTATEYGHIGYGTKTFRSYESAPGGGQERWIAPDGFRTVVSPVPIFDDHEQSYDNRKAAVP